VTVRWTEKAVADLEAIEAHLTLGSERYARALIGRIVDRSERLSQFPQSGPIVTEYGDKSLRELFEHPYRIIYRLLEQEIEILTVIHSARILPREV
jgi:toxin ParE1/3/4